MAAKLTWDDYEDIAVGLLDRFPDIDPLTVRFPDLHRWVCRLEGFEDDPAASTEGKLERIQMAWLDAWRDEHIRERPPDGG